MNSNSSLFFPKNIIILYLIFCQPIFFFAQKQHIKQILKPPFTLSEYILPVLDVDSFIQEDKRNAKDKTIPFRFGINVEVDISMQKHGSIMEYVDKSIWQIKISSKSAKSLNLRFDQFILTKEAQLYIYAPNIDKLYGPYYAHKLNIFSTTIIPDGSLVISLIQPKNNQNSILHIDRVTHGYKALEENDFGLGNSGPCNVNSICPEGNDWRDQIRSTAMIVVGGNAKCSGALINNTCEDGTPYFLTAKHCLNFGTPSSWVYLFNWESPECEQNLSGITDQSISGSELKASSALSDFALLELSTTPPETFLPYYAGWDRSTNKSNQQTTIHHPSGDVKKISFNHDSAQAINYNNTFVWKIDEWETGTTESGSSGAPLFNQDKKIIGQLYGGDASCGNTSGTDYYGRFDISWNASVNNNEQLKFWLDECNTDQETLEGYDPFDANIFQLDAASLGIKNVASRVCSDLLSPKIVVKNNGTDTITELKIHYQASSINDSITWNGTLLPYEIDTILLPTINLTFNGLDTLKIYWDMVNNQPDENNTNNKSQIQYYHINNATSIYLNLLTDYYGSEISWKITDQDEYTLYNDGPYYDATGGVQVNDTFCLSQDSCYTFTIQDSYGDGMGNEGYYDIQNESNDVLIQLIQNNFGYEESQTFCVNDTNTSMHSSITEKKLHLFPNPNNGTFNIFPFNNDYSIIKITNELGQDIGFKKTNSGEIRMAAQNGTYFITIVNQKTKHISIKKVICAKF